MRVAERIISVGGGKGGVGKSVVAANLAVAMAAEGHRVVLVDADLGAPNQHTLFGLTRPGATLQSFLAHEIDRLDEALTDTGVRRLWLLRGASAVFGSANPGHGQKLRLLRNLEALDTEIIVIDVGAGAAFNQLDLFAAGDVKVVVTTPQLTAVENAYAFIKGAVYRALLPLLKTHGFELLLTQLPGVAQTTRLSALLAEAMACSPKLAAELHEFLSSYRARLLGNLVVDPHEAAVFPALSKMTQDFLSISAPVLGAVPTSLAMHESINRRRPLLLEAPDDDAARALRRIARGLLDEPLPKRRPPLADPVELAA
jgi:flagellar biosynthesis protein FlhG